MTAVMRMKRLEVLPNVNESAAARALRVPRGPDWRENLAPEAKHVLQTEITHQGGSMLTQGDRASNIIFEDTSSLVTSHMLLLSHVMTPNYYIKKRKWTLFSWHNSQVLAEHEGFKLFLPSAPSWVCY